METIDPLRAELAAIDSVLADDLYDSKDWRDSGRLGRIDWLHSIYASRCAESELWLAKLCEANDEIDRHVAICAEQATEIESLRADADIYIMCPHCDRRIFLSGEEGA